jgi:hypothetical protein
MSAQDEVSIVVKCLRLGAADYLVKPLRTNELLNLWTHMWRRRRMVCNVLYYIFKDVGYLCIFVLFFLFPFVLKLHPMNVNPFSIKIRFHAQPHIHMY